MFAQTMGIKTKHPLLALCLLLVFAGCTSIEPLDSQLQLIDEPKLGDELESEKGEVLVQKSRVYRHDAIELKNKISSGTKLSGILELEPSTLVAKQRTEKYILYFSDYLKLKWIENTVEPGGLAINVDDPNDVRFHIRGGILREPHESPILVKTQVTDTNKSGFKEVLIFEGLVNDKVILKYNRISSEPLSLSDTKEFHHDLKINDEFDFNGARIKIFEATDEWIRYRVLSNFGL